MPLGFERLNERTQRPNVLINFIRPLPGASSKTSESILNRVAAICYPFMKSNMIVIQALEEFPYNTEFVGRNFNAGEVIQLVLKDRNGCWLPQRIVEMVMVHELAHCKQMNHSKAFWKVRDAYAVELKALWAGGYTGEGLWGRGRTLDSGTLQLDNVNVGDMPEHLCGGTYGRKSRKRRRNGKGKEKKSLSYAERKQRRILKKFGTGGQTLGADDSIKSILENNTSKKGKPRVAGSARGRELRAAAALARFETAKQDEAIKEEETTSDSDTEVEFEESGEEEAAIDVDGRRILDGRGRPLVRLCEDEDDNDKDAQREMEDIEGLQTSKSTSSGTLSGTKHSPLAQSTRQKEAAPPAFAKLSSKVEVSKGLSKKIVLAEEQDKAQPDLSTDISWPKDIPCGVCSLINDPGSITCVACSNVLRLNLVPEHWRCQSPTCKESKYINSGDVAICGICGIRRPSAKNSFS